MILLGILCSSHFESGQLSEFDEMGMWNSWKKRSMFYYSILCDFVQREENFSFVFIISDPVGRRSVSFGDRIFRRLSN